MTFTIGKHKMRNGEEAQVDELVPGKLVGVMLKWGVPVWWGANGKYGNCAEPHPYDLLPPSPPKLDTRTPLTLLELSGLVTDACLSLDGIGQDHAAARLALRRLHDAIHKRVTEQVED